MRAVIEDINDKLNKDKSNVTKDGDGKTGKGCKMLSNIMVGVVETFGCDSFQRGQRRVCSREP